MTYYLPSSFFNRQLDTLAADQSPAQNLANQVYYGKAGHVFNGYSGVGYGNYAWPYSLGFNGPSAFSHPIFCVHPSLGSSNCVPQQVALYYNSGGRQYAWGQGATNLQSHMNAVPIPVASNCPLITGTGNWANIWSGGTDHSCFIWNLDTDEGYEFWELSNTVPTILQSQFPGTTWSAQYGGYIPKVSQFTGVLPNNWGSRGCSLGEVGGLITMQDLNDVFNGLPINHALACAVPMNGGRGVLPATRGDGPGPNGNNVPKTPSGAPNPAYQHDVTFEAQRFRFPADVDLSAVTYPLGRAIAGAIRDHGLYITDTAGAVALYLEDMRTIGSPYNTAANPFSLNWSTIQQGTDPRWGALPTGNTVLHQLPWNQLQALNPITV